MPIIINKFCDFSLFAGIFCRIFFNISSNFSKSYYVVLLEFPLVDVLQQKVSTEFRAVLW